MATTTRTRVLARARVVAGAVVALGVLVHATLVYRVLQAGGFTTTSLLGACARAATGRATTTYKMSEQVRVDHSYFPPGAVCRWSGGTSADLVAPAWWGWTGPALGVLGVVALLLVRFVARSRRRP